MSYLFANGQLQLRRLTSADTDCMCFGVGVILVLHLFLVCSIFPLQHFVVASVLCVFCSASFMYWWKGSHSATPTGHFFATTSHCHMSYASDVSLHLHPSENVLKYSKQTWCILVYQLHINSQNNMLSHYFIYLGNLFLLHYFIIHAPAEHFKNEWTVVYLIWQTFLLSLKLIKQNHVWHCSVRAHEAIMKLKADSMVCDHNVVLSRLFVAICVTIALS